MDKKNSAANPMIAACASLVGPHTPPPSVPVYLSSGGGSNSALLSRSTSSAAHALDASAPDPLPSHAAPSL